MKKILFLLILMMLAGGGLFLSGRYFLAWRSAAPVTLTLEKGSTLRKMSRVLAEKGVVCQPFVFEILARVEGKASRLKPGEYEFEAGLTAGDVLEKIAEGHVKLYKLTIPEGYNMKDMEKPIAGLAIVSVTDWSKAVRQPAWLSAQKVMYPTAEGYLFPDTYLVEKGTTGEDLARRMIHEFWEKVTPDVQAALKERGLSLHQWVTLASLIEKETGAASERPLIASVFFNRLKTGMLLQTDPSVIYGIPNFNGNLTREDLLRDTPYNTYTRSGLPPGPICSPGLDSLMAVLHPAASDYLYFVGKGNGTHYFSKTLDEHNQAVRYYQLHEGEPPSTNAP